jgi:transposase
MTPEREAQLLKLLAEKDAELARRDERIAALETELRFLHEKVDLLVRRMFGRSSEQIDPAQLLLEGLWGKAEAPAPDESPEAGAESPSPEEVAAPSAKAACSRKRSRLPEHLPVEEEVILPPEVEQNPEEYRQIGEEVSERLDYRPARYLRRRTIRPKFVSLTQKARAPLVAPLGAQLAERLSATPAMIAHVVVSKYGSHLPLDRQGKILWERHGLNISRQTLCNWVGLAGHWMRLVYQEVRRDVLGTNYVQVDETPVRYLEAGVSPSRQGYLWTVHRPSPPGMARGPSFYQWHASRATRCLEEVLGVEFSGVIQCDGYAAYESYARTHGLEVAACWAHARRKFYEAKDHHPAMLEVLNLIGRLYGIEKRLRDGGADPASRERVRQRESGPLLAQIHQLLLGWQLRDRFLPGSSAGKAISYTLGLWEKLTLFAGRAEIEIDNNLVENIIRPTAVGKKNWLFIGDEAAGQTSAIHFTLINECRRLGLDPQDYYTRTLEKLPRSTTGDLPNLTPAALASELRLVTVQFAA